MAQIPDQQFRPPGSKASKSGNGRHKIMSRLSEQQWPNWWQAGGGGGGQF